MSSGKNISFGISDLLNEIKTVWNAENTTDETCKCCNSWRTHWQNATKSKTVVCSVSDCNCNDELQIVGAHVVESSADRKNIKGYFIIPLCKGHNHFSNDGSIKIREHTKLIEAKILPTCKK